MKQMKYSRYQNYDLENNYNISLYVNINYRKHIYNNSVL